MDADVHWIADRTLLRSLLRAQPAWSEGQVMTLDEAVAYAIEHSA